MLRLRDFVSRRGEPLQLEALTGDLGLDRQMPEAEVASPGLALAGYTGRFAPNRIHVFGETEITYLNSLSAEERQAPQPLANVRQHNANQLSQLPDRLRSLDRTDPYPGTISPSLQECARALDERNKAQAAQSKAPG